MQDFIEQANHNQALHDELVRVFPDHYYDWKITILFYVAIHYLKALAAMRGVNLGATHHEIGNNIRPPRYGQRPTMPISNTAYSNYSNLLRYSQTARYTGIADVPTFEALKKVDYNMALGNLRDFKLYVQGAGVPI